MPTTDVLDFTVVFAQAFFEKACGQAVYLKGLPYRFIL